MLLNLENGKIESQFHHYVRPTVRPILSNYCVNLTGITQTLINAQPTFPTVYAYFLRWLEEIRIQYQLTFTAPNNRNAKDGCNVTFCSWTNWDLQTFLKLDCTRHGFAIKPMFKAWIDARKLFSVSFNYSN